MDRTLWRLTITLAIIVIMLSLLCAVWEPMRTLLPDWVYDNAGS